MEISDSRQFRGLGAEKLASTAKPPDQWAISENARGKGEARMQLLPPIAVAEPL
jgi:hypothetical protein